MINVGLTAADLFNSNIGTGFKEAGNNETKATIIGFGTLEEEVVNKETGEVETREIAVMKTSEGDYITGQSDVIVKRLKTLSTIVTEEEVKAGLKVRFLNVKAGRGTAVNFIVD